MTCYPTYYGILGVLKGESIETLKEHYELEKNFSAFPDSTIEEAFDVLSNTVKRIKYDEFLTLFLKISIHLPPDKKVEVTKIHHDFCKAREIIPKTRGT